MEKTKVFPTVATYSRFCVQKNSSPDPGEVYIIVATSQNKPKPLPWVFQAPTAQLLCLIGMALVQNNETRKKDNIKASSLHRYKPTPA
jgi:hypothetical protein